MVKTLKLIIIIQTEPHRTKQRKHNSIVISTIIIINNHYNTLTINIMITIIFKAVDKWARSWTEKRRSKQNGSMPVQDDSEIPE